MHKKINQFLRTKHFEYILISIILLLGLFLRLYKVNNPVADWHSWRQADTASVTRFYLKDGINFLYPRYHDISSIQTGKFNPKGYRMVELPIYNAVTTLLIRTFDKFNPEVWGRLVTIFSALTSAFFLYLIGKIIAGRVVGFLAAFFYLFIPFNIYFTRVILPDPMGVMFAVVSIWSFLRFTQSEKIFDLVRSSVFFALALLIKPYLAFNLLPIGYLAVKKYGLEKIFSDRKILIKGVIFLVVAFLPLVIYRGWEARFPEGIPFYTWAFNGSGIRFRPSFWYWIFGIRLSHLILGGLGVIPLVFCILNTKVKNLLPHFMLLGALFYVVIVASANVMHDYYQIPVIPAISLGLAMGSVYLWHQDIYNKVLARSILILSIIVMLVTGWSLIKDNYNINRPEIVQVGRRVNEITPSDALILAPYNGDTALLYQTGRSGWPAVDDSIENIISNGADYYVSVDLSNSDTKLVESRFTTIEKTDKYIIIDLHKPLPKK